MSIVDIFNSFAADFESTMQDDDWHRLKKYFADDATYLNVGGPDPKSEGSEAILAYLKDDLDGYDRRFDSRKLIALTQPDVYGDRLSRRWQCTYRLQGTPDLVVEGEARYLFEGDLIKEIEEEVTPDSKKIIEDWMRQHADKLHF